MSLCDRVVPRLWPTQISDGVLVLLAGPSHGAAGDGVAAGHQRELGLVVVVDLADARGVVDDRARHGRVLRLVG
jgi:hypothetical protein